MQRSSLLTRPLTRRRLLSSGAVTGLGLAAFAVAGCGDDDDEEEGSQATGTAQATSTSAAGAKQFPLVAGWYKGEEVVYYDFGTNTKLTAAGAVATAPIWAFITGMDAQGNPVFVEGQHNIIDTVPGDAGYSDLWEVNMVVVPEDYEADTIRSAAGVVEAGYEVMKPGAFVNCPVVPAGSTLENGEPLVMGWVNEKETVYPDFGMNPPSAVPIWVFATGKNADGSPILVDGQQNVIDLIPEDAGYSAFWQVNIVMVPEDYEANEIKSASDVLASGYDVEVTDLLVNCPVVVRA